MRLRWTVQYGLSWFLKAFFTAPKYYILSLSPPVNVHRRLFFFKSEISKRTVTTRLKFQWQASEKKKHVKKKKTKNIFLFSVHKASLVKKQVLKGHPLNFRQLKFETVVNCNFIFRGHPTSQ